MNPEIREMLTLKEREIPKELKSIRAVSIKENRYEEHSIKKAGFSQFLPKKVNEKLGYLTYWHNPAYKKVLLFIEHYDGFFYYAGVLQPKKKDK